MNQHELSGNPPVRIHIRRSKQARRMSLRVSQLDGKVTLTVPKFVSDKEALSFAREKESWLRAHTAEKSATNRAELGSTVAVFGENRLIGRGQGRNVVLTRDSLLVPGDPLTVPRRLKGYLRHLARDTLVQSADHYAKKLGKDYSRITLRDTRSRWGSCSAQGALMFSWRLVMAPKDVLDYVAAHEVAHLVEMNHSQAFWRTVENLFGDYRQQRKWLHDHGSSLHRVIFED